MHFTVTFDELKNNNLRFIVFTLVFLVSLVFFSCDSIFPTAGKPNVPDDHNNRIGGALHKGNGNELNPDNCEDCHTLDLKGQVIRINGVFKWVPSCYQCHGVKWKNRNNKTFN